MESTSLWMYTMEETETATSYNNLKITRAPLDLVEDISPNDDGGSIFYRDLFMIMYYVLAAGVLLCCIMAHVYIFQRRRNDKRSLVFPRKMSNSYEKADLTGIRPLPNHTKWVENEITGPLSNSGATNESPNIARAPSLGQRSLSLPDGGRGIRESTLYESIDDIIAPKPRQTRSSSQHCIHSLSMACKPKRLPSRMSQSQVSMQSKLPSYNGGGESSNSLATGVAKTSIPSHYTDRYRAARYDRDSHEAKRQLPICSLPTSDPGEIYETIGSMQSDMCFASGPVRTKNQLGHLNPQIRLSTIPERLRKVDRCYVEKSPKPKIPPKPEGRSGSIVRISLSDLQRLRQTHTSQNRYIKNATKEFEFTSGNLPDVVCETKSSAPLTNYNVYDTLRFPEPICDQPPQNAAKSFSSRNTTDTTSPVHEVNKENHCQEGPYDILDHGLLCNGRRVSQEEARAKKTDTNKLENTFDHKTHNETTANTQSRIDHKMEKQNKRLKFSQKQDSPIYFTLEPNFPQNTLNPCQTIFEDERQGERSNQAFMRSQSMPCSSLSSPPDSETCLEESVCSNSHKWQNFRYRKADSRQKNRKSVIVLHGMKDELL